MNKLLKNEVLNIALIHTIKQMSEIFLGPFLALYFITKSIENIPKLALYYVLVYLFGIIIWYFAGKITNKENKILMLRIGIAMECIYMIMFPILNEKIIDYIILLALIKGAANSCFYSVYNHLVGVKVTQKDRRQFEILTQILKNITYIIIPILFGFLINTTSYITTGIIMLVLCIVQLLISLTITAPKENNNNEYNPLESFKKYIKNKTIKDQLVSEIFKGLTINNGVLNLLVTILIINAYKNSVDLGLITSLGYILSIVLMCLMKKYIKNDKKIIDICTIVPLVMLLSLIFFNSNITVLIYSLIYNSLISILIICSNTRLWNVENKLIEDNDKVEFWYYREAFLALGRLIGYGLLAILYLFQGETILYLYITLLAFLLPLIRIYLHKQDNYS